MVSRKNIEYKRQQNAKRVLHYGIRKLSVGVASVLLGTVVYMQNGNTVHADVNPTVSAGNDSAKVADENVGVGYSAGASSGINSSDSANSVVAAGNTTNSTTPSQPAASPVQKATGQGNNTAAAVGESQSVASAGQAKPGVNQVVVSDNIKAVTGSAAIPNRPASVAAGNPIKGRSFANLSVKPSFLAVSKVASTGTSNNVVNGGFDQATWGTLDASKWTGQIVSNQDIDGVTRQYYELTGYTGDMSHIIVPNEADLEAAGINTDGHQVGINADMTHSWFENGAPKTIAFSKTNNEMVKALGSDWTSAFTGTYNRHGHYAGRLHSLTKFDGADLTVSNVTNMGYMFYENQISDLRPLANWKTNNVTNMSSMFGFNQISDLRPLANWKTDNVTDMSDMFYQNQVSDLTPLASWKTDNVTNMSGMFNENHINDLTPLANWKTNNVTNMSSMFKFNQVSDLIPLANWKIDNVTDMNTMFSGNRISDLRPLANWKTDNVTNMSSMFYANQISDLAPLSNWKTDNVTDMSYMFYNNQISDLAPLANWKTDSVTDMSYMFYNNQISDLAPLSNWKTDNVTNMSNMFYENQISDLAPLANWKTDNVTDMNYMFASNQISNLAPLANWKTDNVTDMSAMFGLNQISDLAPLANWKTGNVTNMGYMFSNNQIAYADFTKWSFPEVDYLEQFINQSTPCIIIVKSADQALFSGTSQPGLNDDMQDQVINTKQNQLHFGSDTVDMPTVYVASDKADVRQKILADINTKVSEYQANHIDKMLTPTVPLDQLTNLVDLANAKFTVGKRALSELDTNDAFALDPVNGLHEHKNVNDNGGYDTDFWGTLDVSKFTTVKNGDNLEITGYNGDAAKVIIPNIADFELNNLDQGAKQVTISSRVMHKLAKNATRIGLSKTGNQKVAASDAVWQDAFGGLTNKPGTSSDADGGIWVYNPNLTAMDLHNLDTTNITDMSAMFNGGHNLTVVGDLSQWNVANVVSMRDMFQTASSLTDIGDLDNWNTSKVTDMTSMFSNATNLTNIGDLSKWNTGNVTNMHNMFANATGLTNIGNLDNWNTSKVTDMSWMFGTDSGKQSHLTNIGDLSNWNTSKVTDMHSMFANATNLTNIGNLDNWDTSKVTDMSWMFDDTTNLINIGDLSNWNTSKVTDMHNMFANATNLTNIGNLDNWDTNNVTDMSWMFGGTTNLTNIGDLSKWQTGNVTNMNSMFYNATSLINIGDLSKWNTSEVTDMHWMFGTDSSKQSHLTNIGDLSNWNTSKVTDMHNMFANATNLTNIGNLDNWDTNKVTDMSWMFGGITNLTNIGDLSKWNTGNVTDMHNMFANATGLTNIGNLDDWNTSKVTNMSWMFGTDSGKQSHLTNIGDLSKWQTGNVTDMSYMFANATGLTNIGNLDNWNTSKVTNMMVMFYNATHLTNIGDLSKWNTSKVTNMIGIFGATNALRHLNISNWNLTKLANKDAMKYMFVADPNLTVIANNLTLPAWYQNEINDANYFWSNHMAVITNVPELIKSTGDIDNLKIDDQNASRSIFYDSKGSSDAIQVLKDANQAYIKQYQNEHPGYTLNLAADVDQTDPIALANARFVSVPREVQFTIAYYDLTGKLVDSMTSTHKVGDTVSISLTVPNNYVLVSGQSSTDRLMHWGLNEVDFLVEPKLTQTTETKTVSRTIKVQTPDGQTHNVVQAVTFVRNGYSNQVTKQTTYSSWSFNSHYQFSGYQPKPVDGYTADVIPALSVTPDSLDTTVSVAYHKIPAVYSVRYQLANGTVVKDVFVTPEHDGMIHLMAPQGYRLLTTVTDVQAGHSSQKLAVLVAPAEQTYTAHDDLPSGVTKPLTKTVTRTVKITMPNGHVRTIKQSVKFERTATVDSTGQVTYSNWQAIGRAQFNKVFVPKRFGYHLVGQADKLMVTANMIDSVIEIKYVKN